MTASNARPPLCNSGFALSKKAEDRISKWVSGGDPLSTLLLLSNRAVGDVVFGESKN
jgi:hypothetical protein